MLFTSPLDSNQPQYASDNVWYNNGHMTVERAIQKNSISPQTAAVTGDQVIFSQEAKDMAAPRPPLEKVSVLEEVEATYTPVKQVTLKDGTQVLVESRDQMPSASRGSGTTGARVTITGTDGSTRTETLTESAALYKDEQGQWQVRTGAVAGEGDQWDDYLQSVKGTDGNDIIIVLSGSKGHTTYSTVDAGEGDNLVVDLSGGRSTITSGSGDDIIVTSGSGKHAVVSGAGNDTLELAGESIIADTGGGDDSVSITGNAGSVRVDTGAGNDSVAVNGKVNTLKVDAGDGDDRVTVAGARNVDIKGGAGTDAITVQNAGVDKDAATSSAYSELIPLSIRKYSAEIEARAATVNIDGGAGNDSIVVDTVNANGRIAGGAGNDDIKIQNANSAYGLTINGDDGNDTITVDNASEAQKNWTPPRVVINGGAGNDTITAGTLNNTQIDGGQGNDTISADALHASFVNGGEGNDTISVDDLHASSMNGGDGNDTIDVQNMSGNMLNKVNGGEGNDSLTIGTVQGGRVVSDTGDTVRVDRLVDASLHASGTGSVTVGSVESSLINLTGTEGTVNLGTVTDSMIIGSGGVNITAESVSRSLIETGEGEDTITIARVDNSAINTGDGNDTVNIGTLTGSALTGAAGNDSLHVGLADHSSISSDAEQVTLTIEHPDKQFGLMSTGTTTLRGALPEEDVTNKGEFVLSTLEEQTRDAAMGKQDATTRAQKRSAFETAASDAATGKPSRNTQLRGYAFGATVGSTARNAYGVV